jgi:hypothetical protein
MSPAPTIRLATTAAPAAPKLPGGAAPTMALPKATVQLQAPTQPLGTSFSSPSQVATTQDDEDDEDGKEGLVNILSGVGLAAALIVLAFQLMTANTWISAEDNPNKGDWTQLSPL